jgi:hypothetical protein
MLDHLDTLISFVVIISGLSVVVTTLTQMISAALGLRGSNLRWGLKTLIEQLDPGLKEHATTLSERVLQHPLISDSSFSGFRTRLITRWKLASTIRKEELLDILHRLSTGDAGGTSDRAEPWRIALQGALDRFDRAAVEQLLAGVRDARALPAIGGTGTMSVEDMVKAAALLPRNIDEWFGPVMDRVSQRFALHTRVWTVMFSFVLAFALHLDTFRIMVQLSSDAELRAHVASGADALMSRAEVPAAATASAEADPARRELLGSANRLQSLLTEQMSFRLIPEPYPDPFYEYWKPGWSHLWGILLSGILISLGAPFWFNALKTLCNLRPTVASRVDKETDSRQST